MGACPPYARLAHSAQDNFVPLWPNGENVALAQTSAMRKRKKKLHLAALLSRKGKTADDLMVALDVDRSTVTRWLNGTRLPEEDNEEKLAAYFEIKVDALYREPAAISIDALIAGRTRQEQQAIADVVISVLKTMKF